MNRRALIVLGLGAAAVPALAACGTTDPAATTAGASQPAGSAEPITVTDSRGKQVTLNGPATKVVTLEWSSTEMVVTLGVQPVGVADPKGYAAWVSSAPLTGDTVDVGLRSEPSVESVAKVAPDLILGIDGSIPDGAMAQMEKIAPVVLLTGADASKQVALMRENFTTTAKLLGKTEVATTVLAELDTKITTGKAALERAGKAGAEYVFAYPSVTGNQLSFRMHAAGSLPGAYAALLGLKQVWTGTADKQWGIGDADLEALTRLPAGTEFLYWKNSEADPVPTLNKNKIWAGLPFVKAGQVHPAADRIWVYGGPASMGQWAADVVALITA